MRTTVNRKTFLLSLLLFITASAWAEWAKINEISTEKYYIDPSTIRKDGVMRKFWALKDFKQLNSSGWMSMRFRQEYDCKEERYRGLSISSYAEPMAEGRVMFTNNFEKPDSWKDIPPGTDVEAIMKFVCTQ